MALRAPTELTERVKSFLKTNGFPGWVVEEFEDNSVCIHFREPYLYGQGGRDAIASRLPPEWTITHGGYEGEYIGDSAIPCGFLVIQQANGADNGR